MLHSLMKAVEMCIVLMSGRATGAKIDSVFICGGIHAEEIDLDGDTYNHEKLNLLCEKHNARPTFVAPYFCL